VSRRSRLLEAHTNARHALAKLENKEPGESSTAIREYQHDIRELKTNMARLEELHSLELLRSGR
jgi:hypothetical protein